MKVLNQGKNLTNYILLKWCWYLKSREVLCMCIKHLCACTQGQQLIFASGKQPLFHHKKLLWMDSDLLGGGTVGQHHEGNQNDLAVVVNVPCHVWFKKSLTVLPLCKSTIWSLSPVDKMSAAGLLEMHLQSKYMTRKHHLVKLLF